MSYVLNAGDTAPPLVLTATDTTPMPGTGWVLRIYRPDGAVLVDNAPTVDATDPTAIKVTHTWLAGETEQSGLWGVEAERAGRSYPPTGPVRFVVTPQGASAYATVQDAKDAGAVGDDAAILVALRAAEARVDRYTGDRWAPTPMVLTARVSGDGRTILLRRRVRSISAVQMVGATTPLAASGYAVLSSDTPTQQDAIILGGLGYGNALVAGAEPWRGGWANLYGRSIVGQVTVTGVFGHAQPPPEVVQATAAIAAWLTTLGAGAAGPAAPSVDDEGNSLTITTTVDADQPLSRGTGVAAADALLAGLVRRRVRLAG